MYVVGSKGEAENPWVVIYWPELQEMNRCISSATMVEEDRCE
jgi:hypothetical protein